MKSDAILTMIEMCDAAGLDIHRMEVTLPGQYVHEVGGARMGDNRDRSVVKSINRCRETTNLFVLDR